MSLEGDEAALGSVHLNFSLLVFSEAEASGAPVLPASAISIVIVDVLFLFHFEELSYFLFDFTDALFVHVTERLTSLLQQLDQSSVLVGKGNLRHSTFFLVFFAVEHWLAVVVVDDLLNLVLEVQVEPLDVRVRFPFILIILNHFRIYFHLHREVFNGRIMNIPVFVVYV